MNVISLQNIEKSYGTRLLFKEVNITFTTEKRLGLVGINGTGKSTFLKILAGQMEPDKGTIERNGKASIHYLAQTPEFDPDSTLLEAVLDGDHPRLRMVQSFERISREYREMQETGGEDAKVSRNYMNALEQMDQQDGWQVEQEARIILSKLGFPDVNQKVAMLSGGQKRRLALGQALLYPCDLLLLDEPTNHLDEDSIDWLESYLSARQGGLLISTHDRYFLDSVCNALARTTKQKARLDRYEKLKNMEKTRRPDQMDPIALKTRLGKTIFDIEHLAFYFGERPMIKDFTYHVVRHDRIGIVGPNGVGKSTFMNILDGTYEPTSGTIGKGETVRIAHFKQELPEFDEDMRVLDYIREDHSYMVLGDGSTLSAGQILERFLFTPELHGVPIRKLSGGERRRLYLLKLLMSAPNVLLLDEPTNDLDIPTLEVLEDFLDSFSGIIITVCHDRYFLDRVVDKLFVFSGDGQIEIVHGSYSDYKDALDESSIGKRPFYIANTNADSRANTNDNSKKVIVEEVDSTQHQSDMKSVSDDITKVDNDGIDTFKGTPKKGLNKAEAAEYAKIMDELPKLEHLVKGLDVMISQVATDYEKMQSLMSEREETQSQIDALTERWMELEERL